MLNLEKLEVCGQVFWSCDFLTFGDYDNSGAVERANVRYLEDRHEALDIWADYRELEEEVAEKIKKGTVPELLVINNMYGYCRAWIRSDIAVEEEYFERLKHFPAFDDELVNKVEQELIKQAWGDWIRDDLFHELRLKPAEITSLDDETLFGLFIEACSEIEEFPVIEAGGSVWVDVAQVAERYGEKLKNLVPAEKWQEAQLD